MQALEEIADLGIFRVGQDRSFSRDFEPFAEESAIQSFADAINSGYISPEQVCRNFFGYREDARLWGMPRSIEWHSILPECIPRIVKISKRLRPDMAEQVVEAMIKDYMLAKRYLGFDGYDPFIVGFAGALMVIEECSIDNPRLMSMINHEKSVLENYILRLEKYHPVMQVVKFAYEVQAMRKDKGNDADNTNKYVHELSPEVIALSSSVIILYNMINGVEEDSRMSPDQVGKVIYLTEDIVDSVAQIKEKDYAGFKSLVIQMMGSREEESIYSGLFLARYMFDDKDIKKAFHASTKQIGMVDKFMEEVISILVENNDAEGLEIMMGRCRIAPYNDRTKSLLARSISVVKGLSQKELFRLYESYDVSYGSTKHIVGSLAENVDDRGLYRAFKLLKKANRAVIKEEGTNPFSDNQRLNFYKNRVLEMMMVILPNVSRDWLINNRFDLSKYGAYACHVFQMYITPHGTVPPEYRPKGV